MNPDPCQTCQLPDCDDKAKGCEWFRLTKPKLYRQTFWTNTPRTEDVDRKKYWADHYQANREKKLKAAKERYARSKANSRTVNQEA